MEKLQSNLIRAKLAEAGMTQNDLADAIKMSRVAFNQKLNGVRKFTVDELCEIASVLKCKVSFFVK